MNHKTIAALALACAGFYAAPAFAGNQTAFFEGHKKPAQSFSSLARNFYNHDIYVRFDESDSYRRVMQSYASNHNFGNNNLFDSKFVPNLEGGVTNSITAPVPEPETYAMMAAGLLIISSVARRRRKQG